MSSAEQPANLDFAAHELPAATNDGFTRMAARPPFQFMAAAKSVRHCFIAYLSSLESTCNGSGNCFSYARFSLDN